MGKDKSRIKVKIKDENKDKSKTRNKYKSKAKGKNKYKEIGAQMLERARWSGVPSVNCFLGPFIFFFFCYFEFLVSFLLTIF